MDIVWSRLIGLVVGLFASGLALAQSADLSITQSDSPDPVLPGGTVTYTLAVTNLGPDPAASVEVTYIFNPVLIRSGFSGLGWDCKPVGSVGSLRCSRADGQPLQLGSAPPLTLTFTAPNAATVVSNSASVSSAAFDRDSANNSDTEDTRVEGADLSLDKNAPIAVPQNGSLTYTLSVSNAGPSPAVNVQVIDTLPNGVRFQDWEPSGEWACSIDDSKVTCDRSGALADDAVSELQLHTTAPASVGTLTNTASVTSSIGDQDGANNSDSAQTQVVAGSDLSISKTDGSAFYTPGQNIEYTVTVLNLGPTDAGGDGFEVRDVVPSSIENVSATCTPFGAGNKCGTNVAPTGSNTIAFTGAALRAGVGSRLEYRIGGRVRSDATGNLTNTATVVPTAGGSAPVIDPKPDNNSATDTDVPYAQTANLSIEKIDTVDPVAVGGTISYQISVSNAGPGSAASLSVHDTLPAGVSFVSASGTDWVCKASPAGDVDCEYNAPLAVGQAPPVTVTVQAPGTPTTLTNTASVSSPTVDSNAANNSDDETTQVVFGGNVSLSISDAPDPVPLGEVYRYTLSVANAGPETQSEVVIKSELPSEADYVSAVGADWTCVHDPDGNTLKCSLGSPLAIATAPELVITMVAPETQGTVSMTAAAGGTRPDANLANNEETELTMVGGVPVAEDDRAETLEDTPITQDAAWNDIPGDAPNRWELVGTYGGAANGTVFMHEGTFAYLPNRDFHGDDSFTYELCDGSGECDRALVEIKVIPDAGSIDVPDARDDRFAPPEDTSMTANVARNDYVGDAPGTWMLVPDNGPFHGSVSMDPNGSFDYTPNAHFHGSDRFTYQLCDSSAPQDCDTALVEISVTPDAGSNDVPDARDDRFDTPEGTDVMGDASRNDVVADLPGTWRLVGNAANGAATMSPEGRFTYRPNPTFYGTDRFTYQLCDSTGDCDTAEVIVVVATTLPDLAVTKTDNVDFYLPGDDLRYTITVTNVGSARASGFTIADHLPQGISVLQLDCIFEGDASCGLPAYTAESNTIFYGPASLGPGTGNAITMTVVARVLENTACNLINEAGATVPVEGDANTSNNAAIDLDMHVSSPCLFRDGFESP